MSEYNNCKPEIIGLDVEKGWTTNWPIEPCSAILTKWNPVLSCDKAFTRYKIQDTNFYFHSRFLKQTTLANGLLSPRGE